MLSEATETISKQNARKNELSHQFKKLREELENECNLYKYYIEQLDNFKE